eukprot:2526631-Amphidinium_carterae.1
MGHTTRHWCNDERCATTPEHFPRIPVKQLQAEDPKKNTNRCQWRTGLYTRNQQLTIAYNNLAILTTFIITDRLLSEVKLHYIGNHFYLKAIVFDGLCDYVDYTKAFESWCYDWFDDFKQEYMIYGLHQQENIQQVPIYGDYIFGNQSQQEANIPCTLKTPTVPTHAEIDKHNLTHLPYRDWCKHCVQGERKQYHQKGGLCKQRITQIDYAFLKSDNDRHHAKVLTMFKSTTGLGHATMVPYK